MFLVPADGHSVQAECQELRIWGPPREPFLSSWNPAQAPSPSASQFRGVSTDTVDEALCALPDVWHVIPGSELAPESVRRQADMPAVPATLAKSPSEGSSGLLQAAELAVTSDEARRCEIAAGRGSDATSSLFRCNSGMAAVTREHTSHHLPHNPLEDSDLRETDLSASAVLFDSGKGGGQGCRESSGQAHQNCEVSRGAPWNLSIMEASAASDLCHVSTSGPDASCHVNRAAGARTRHRAQAPTRQELQEAVPLLDTNMDGKIWEDDLDMLVQLAFTVDVHSAPASWQDLKQALQSIDGLISVGPLQTAVKIGLVHKEAEKMRVLSTRSCRGLGFKGRDNKGFWGPFSTLRSYLEAFNKFDRDRNGVICARDLKMASCLLVGLSIGQSECRELIARVDTNCNGVVDLLEFGALVDLLTSASPDFEALAHVMTTDMSKMSLSSVAAFLSLDVSELDVLMRSAMADFVEVFMHLHLEATKMA